MSGGEQVPGAAPRSEDPGVFVRAEPGPRGHLQIARGRAAGREP